MLGIHERTIDRLISPRVQVLVIVHVEHRQSSRELRCVPLRGASPLVVDLTIQLGPELKIDHIAESDRITRTQVVSMGSAPSVLPRENRGKSRVLAGHSRK
jgi:hypothetical protein